MDDATRDELAALRRRAYGPDADIVADPAASARLAELEERARAAGAPGPGTPTDEAATATPDQAAPESALDPIDPLGVLRAGVEEADTVGDERVLRPPRPVAAPWIVAWAVSVIAVAVLVGGLVFGLASMPPVAGSGPGRQISTLTEKADLPDAVRGWIAGRDTSAFAFEGLIVVPTPAGVGPSGSGATCLLVAPREGYGSDGSAPGEAFWGCQAGSFPASAQFVVSTQSPKALRARFPDGTALRFVLDGDRVGVFIDDSTPASSPPTA